MEKSRYMKIFAYGFVWKSTKQLQSASKQRTILHLEHRILQVRLHNLHQFLLVLGLGQCATDQNEQSQLNKAPRVHKCPGALSALSARVPNYPSS